MSKNFNKITNRSTTELFLTGKNLLNGMALQRKQLNFSEDILIISVYLPQMKTILLLISCYLGLWLCNANGKSQDKKIKNISSLVTDTVNYRTQIQPMLQEKCSPCHFTGGKMYARMPFDKGETIIAHKTGILKRIKDEEKIALIRQYINQKTK